MAFIRVLPFRQKQAFDMWIGQPIQSRATDCFRPLRYLLGATCLRRTKASCGGTLHLPQKREVINYVDLNQQERDIYSFFQRRSYLLATESNQGASRKTKRKTTSKTLQLIGLLRLICNHSEGLLPAIALEAWRKKDRDALSWGMLEANIRQCNLCNSSSGMEDVTIDSQFACEHRVCSVCISATHEDADGEPTLLCPICSAPACSEPTASKKMNTREAALIPSTKILALLENILSADGKNGKDSSKWYVQGFAKCHKKC